MPYFELIYETGNHSVAEYADENEAVAACNAHTARAMAGETGGPTGHPAERVSRCLMYEAHPADYMSDMSASKDEVLALVKSLADKNGVVSFPALIAELNEQMHCMVNERAAHDSSFKMPELKELTL